MPAWERKNVLINYSRRRGVGEEKRDGGEVVKKQAQQNGNSLVTSKKECLSSSLSTFSVLPSPLIVLHLPSCLASFLPLLPSSCLSFLFISSSTIFNLPVSLPPVFTLSEKGVKKTDSCKQTPYGLWEMGNIFTNTAKKHSEVMKNME